MGTTRALEDRRSGPRREAERLLHYATENLIATALAVGRTVENHSDEENRRDAIMLLDKIQEAAANFAHARDAMAPGSPPEAKPPKTKSETAAHYAEMLSGESEPWEEPEDA